LKEPAKAQEGLVNFNVKDNVTVKQLRTMEQMGPELLQKLLGGPGWPADIGHKTWALMNGLDDSEVAQARELPKQISLEDSYTRLDTYEEVVEELKTLSRSLIKRMHIDLLEDGKDDDDDELPNRRWLAHPKTIRLSTRPRGALDPLTGTRARSFQRVSRSAPLPNFIFNLNDSVDTIADRLVDESLLPLFRKLHPEKSGWNLSLLNVAVTNMVETASDSKSASGRDIGSMFKNQEDVLREWKVDDRDVPPQHSESEADHNDWLSDEEMDEDLTSTVCHLCGTQIPLFAMAAHQRFHENGD
jgi:DNA polymerase iota